MTSSSLCMASLASLPHSCFLLCPLAGLAWPPHSIALALHSSQSPRACTFLSFFFSLSLSLGFFSFFLGFLLFFSTAGTLSFSGDFTASAFLCFWTGSFSLSAKGLGGGEDPGSPG